MGNPFNRGPLPRFIDQGREGVTMWDKYPLTFLFTFLTNMCTRCTSSIRPFLPVSTRSRNSSRHRVFHLLPGWFGVDRVSDLALSYPRETMRTHLYILAISRSWSSFPKEVNPSLSRVDMVRRKSWHWFPLMWTSWHVRYLHLSVECLLHPAEFYEGLHICSRRVVCTSSAYNGVMAFVGVVLSCIGTRILAWLRRKLILSYYQCCLMFAKRNHSRPNSRG